MERRGQAAARPGWFFHNGQVLNVAAEPPTMVGADGCRSGAWMVAADHGRGRPELRLLPSTADLFHLLGQQRCATAVLDIPIGLPESGPRECDKDARLLLGRRASTVFSAPLGRWSWPDPNRRPRSGGADWTGEAAQRKPSGYFLAFERWT